MRMLFVTLMLAVTALAQEKTAATPPQEETAATSPQEKPAVTSQAPVQGPPPKNLTKFPDGHFSANAEPKDSENYEIRVVVAGDTLWGIATDVLKDGKLWPQIWEQNEHVVNPHWIYPKDKILIRQITRITEAKPPEPEAPAPPQEEPTPEQPPQEQPPQAPPPRRPYVVPPYPEPPPPPGPLTIVDLAPPRVFPEVKEADLYCSGFIRSGNVSTGIEVTRRFGTSEILAASGDYVYVSRGLEDGVKPGTTYQVIRPTKNVNALGRHYLEIAQVEIMIGQPGYALARVTQSCEALELGDVLIPFNQTSFPALPSNRPFSPTMKASGQVPGNVVMTKMAMVNTGSRFGSNVSLPATASSSLRTLDRGVAGTSDVVYLDVGQAEGAKPGDLFIVYRNAGLRDGSIFNSRDDSETARIAIAEVVILKVEERASTALVTYSADAIGLGDFVERR